MDFGSARVRLDASILNAELRPFLGCFFEPLRLGEVALVTSIVAVLSSVAVL